MQREYLIKREVKRGKLFITTYEYNYETGHVVVDEKTGAKVVVPEISIIDVKPTALMKILRIGGIAVMLAIIALVCIIII